MAVTSIGDFVSAALARQPATLTQQATASATTSAVTATQPDSNVSISSTPGAVLNTANLQSTSVGLAQLSSLLEEAQSGTQQIGSVLQQLQNLAGEAATGGPPTALASLDSEFQQLLMQLNQVAAGTSFGGTNLLDGSLSGQAAAGDNTVSSSLTIPNLTASGLFGNTSPNLLNVSNASQALVNVASAHAIVASANGDIVATQTQTSIASANVDTALANNNASTAVLSENDLTTGSTGDFLAGLLNNLSTTASAQTGNLSPTLLSLLQE